MANLLLSIVLLLTFCSIQSVKLPSDVFQLRGGNDANSESSSSIECIGVVVTPPNQPRPRQPSTRPRQDVANSQIKRQTTKQQKGKTARNLTIIDLTNDGQHRVPEQVSVRTNSWQGYTPRYTPRFHEALIPIHLPQELMGSVGQITPGKYLGHLQNSSHDQTLLNPWLSTEGATTSTLANTGKSIFRNKTNGTAAGQAYIRGNRSRSMSDDTQFRALYQGHERTHTLGDKSVVADGRVQRSPTTLRSKLILITFSSWINLTLLLAKNN